MREICCGSAPVLGVEDGSPAWEAGLRPGDGIISIDGAFLRDAVDCFLLLATDTAHRLVVERDGRRFVTAIDTVGRPPGLSFGRSVFGPLMKCNNHCMFCFIDQMPAGLRPTLYVKDDDYRLSFLEGNFITLTNLRRRDVRRIVEERLSPLYVSLHSTDPQLRARLFVNRRAYRALDVLRQLDDAGIETHLQIVTLKGLNDGESLDATLEFIVRHYSMVASVGVVPVGIASGGRLELDARYGHDRASSSLVLEQLDGWRARMGEAGPFAADEFFFLAGERPPGNDYYHGYPQAENGIGLASMFADSMGDSTSTARDGREAVVTSPMGLWALRPLRLDRFDVRTIVVGNSLFGERVNVCGLLPGKDVTAALERESGLARAFIPGVALSGGAFIDGLTLDDVSRRVGITLVPLISDARLLIESAAGGDA